MVHSKVACLGELNTITTSPKTEDNPCCPVFSLFGKRTTSDVLPKACHPRHRPKTLLIRTLTLVIPDDLSRSILFRTTSLWECNPHNGVVRGGGPRPRSAAENLIGRSLTPTHAEVCRKSGYCLFLTPVIRHRSHLQAAIEVPADCKQLKTSQEALLRSRRKPTLPQRHLKSGPPDRCLQLCLLDITFRRDCKASIKFFDIKRQTSWSTRWGDVR
jgi:hypothetical protein